MQNSGDSLVRHEDEFLTLQETALDRRMDMAYRKTYPFEGSFINTEQANLVEKVSDMGMIATEIEGWLFPADALKLYELSYFSDGDILELGTYRGLSASIEACASSKRGLPNVIVSVDLDPNAVVRARANLLGRPGAERVHIFAQEAGKGVRDLATAKRQFKFCFIDHSHRYEDVFDVCTSLHRVLVLGSFALFHDFNDPRNADPKNADYGVYQGVMDGLHRDRFEFWGIYGCCGLFRRIGPC